jgi:hypothetical protein
MRSRPNNLSFQRKKGKGDLEINYGKNSAYYQGSHRYQTL